MFCPLWIAVELWHAVSGHGLRRSRWVWPETGAGCGGRRGVGRLWTTGGNPAGANGAEGSRKGDRAVIQLTRLTQPNCGRFTDRPQ